jgi:hypothetical protein
LSHSQQPGLLQQRASLHSAGRRRHDGMIEPSHQEHKPVVNLRI